MERIKTIDLLHPHDITLRAVFETPPLSDEPRESGREILPNPSVCKAAVTLLKSGVWHLEQEEERLEAELKREIDAERRDSTSIAHVARSYDDVVFNRNRLECAIGEWLKWQQMAEDHIGAQLDREHGMVARTDKSRDGRFAISGMAAAITYGLLAQCRVLQVDLERFWVKIEAHSTTNGHEQFETVIKSNEAKMIQAILEADPNGMEGGAKENAVAKVLHAVGLYGEEGAVAIIDKHIQALRDGENPF